MRRGNWKATIRFWERGCDLVVGANGIARCSHEIELQPDGQAGSGLIGCTG